MNRNPTNSGLERAFLCRVSNVLPHADVPSAAAEDGTVWHRFKQRVVELQAEGLDLADARISAVAEAPEIYRDALRAVPVERLRDLDLDPARCAVEVAFAYDVATGKARELGRGKERAYGTLSPTEYAGTSDYVALLPADGVKIRDWKRGRSKRTPAARNLQLKKCALDACRAYGRIHADVEIVRLGDGGEPWFDQAHLEPFDLDSFALELEDLHRRIESDRADYARGILPDATVTEEGCAFCPALRFCPASMAMVRALSEGEELQNLAEGRLLITPENAPRLAKLLPQMEKRLDLVKEALKTYACQEYARKTPVVGEDGRIYGPRPDVKKVVTNVAVAKEILASELGPKAAAAAVSPESMTKGGIEDARRAYFEDHPEAKKVKGAAGKMDEKLFALLHDAGALRVFESPVVTWFTPKEK